MRVCPMRNLECITSSFLVFFSTGHSPIVSYTCWSWFYIWSSHDFRHLSNMDLLMVGFRTVYGIFVLDMSIFVALFSLSFPCIPMWLRIQMRMMLSFSEREFILFRSSVMRRVVVPLFWSTRRTYLKKSWLKWSNNQQSVCQIFFIAVTTNDSRLSKISDNKQKSPVNPPVQYWKT